MVKVEGGNGAHDGISKGDGDDDIDGGYNNKGETVGIRTGNRTGNRHCL